MHLRAAFRSAGGFACLLTAAAAVAAPPAGPAPLPQSPEVMLYVSRPIGAGGGGFRLPNLSLRVGQVRMGANSGSPSAGDPMQHRGFISLEVAGRPRESALDMRLELLGRVTYDVNRGLLDFPLPADGWRRAADGQIPIPGRNPAGFQSKPITARFWEVSALKRDLLNDTRKPSLVVRDSSALAYAAPGPRQ